MGQKSSIKRLDPHVRNEVDRLIRGGVHTIDAIHHRIADLGGKVSRSALGRYYKSTRAEAEHTRAEQREIREINARLESIERTVQEIRTLLGETLNGR